MCKRESKAWERRQPPTPSSSKQMYLITDDGFLRRFLLNLLFLTSLILFCAINPTSRDIALDVYYDTKDYMMELANEMAWWSLLGLLSSSCCAIQVLLNALSLGCAGLNTILGPIRPTFVALSILAQASSWYAAYFFEGSSSTSLRRTTAASTALSAILTLMPEMLAWQTARRERMRQLQFARNATSTSASSCIELKFQLSTMGCSSCVSTISKVLDGIDGVLRHRVILEDGCAHVVLDESVVRRRMGSNKTTRSCENSIQQHDVFWTDIADQLQTAGFPVTGYKSKKEQ